MSLWKSDPTNAGFNLYRQSDRGQPVKVNQQPVTASTNLVDATAPAGKANRWFVRAVAGGREQAASETVSLPADAPPNQVFTIKLKGDYAANKVAIADLDGDGVFDYVIKQPGGGLDPGTARQSPDTYKLEAYDGQTRRFRWRYDLGWNMNMGVWWTPYIVAVAGQEQLQVTPITGLPFAITLAGELPESLHALFDPHRIPGCHVDSAAGGGDVIVAVFGELHAVVTLHYRFEAEEALRIGGATPYRGPVLCQLPFHAGNERDAIGVHHSGFHGLRECRRRGD